MATSPNYGWLEPDNTDLVKNGALAIRTLGNAIDTTMATMTPKSTYTAKGSIAAATAASTPANLAVGNNGETLVADSSTSTGLRYQPTTAAGKNAVINGGFDVWQRGTSGTSRGYNSADRWFCNNPGVGGRTFSRQASDLAGFQYFMRMQRTAGNTATDGFSITYNAETADSMRFAGKTVTLSWWMRKGANYSGGGVRGGLYSGTGTDQNLDNAYTGAATVVSLAGTPTTSWVRYQVTGTVSSSATELAFTFVWDPSGTAGAADYLDIVGFQLEEGSIATGFTRAGGTIQGELSAAQRYYYRTTPGAIYTTFSSGWSTSSTSFLVVTPLPVVMRIAPTALEQTGTASNYGVFQGSAGVTCSAIPALYHATNSTVISNFTVASGLTVGQAGVGRTDNSTAGYLGWSAEL